MSKYEIGQIVARNEEPETDLEVVDYHRGWYTLSDDSKAREEDLCANEEIVDETNDEEEESTRSMAKTLAKYRAGYETGVTAEGRKSLNNGDEIAHMLEGWSAEQVMTAAEKICGLEPGELVAKYEHLNRGAKRMNAGNRIRAFAKREDKNAIELMELVKS